AAVATQIMLKDATDPDLIAPQSWSRSLLQMEAVLRVSVGRTPQVPFERTKVIDSETKLKALARNADAALVTKAKVAWSDIDLFARCQIDPAYKEVRMSFMDPALAKSPRTA
ncbi:MAG: hypothetical protein AAF386_10280, partial [Pseudomonadota bacterium]